jgi:hypothetical protein
MFVVRGLQFPEALVFAAIPMSVLFFSLSGRAVVPYNLVHES